MLPAKIVPHIAFRYHSEWGYWFRPNLRIRYPRDAATGSPSWMLRTNAAGGPCLNEIDAKPNGRQPVLFIGCSFAAGDGVSTEDNFVSRLESGRPDLLCHNYSLNGSGNCQQLLFHNHFAPRVNPEVLVLAPYTGCAKRTVIRERPTYDPLSNRKVERPNPFCLLDDQDRLHLGNNPVPRVTEHLAGRPRPAPKLFVHPPGQPLSERAPISPRFLPPSIPPEATPKVPSFEIYAHPEGNHYRIVKRVLRATIECSNAPRRILMPLPHLNNLRFPEQEYRHLYEEVAAETGCEFHDLTPDFEPWRGTDFAPLFLDGNGHYAPAAHRVIARSLTKLL